MIAKETIVTLLSIDEIVGAFLGFLCYTIVLYMGPVCLKAV